jgi:hypothetical protein
VRFKVPDNSMKLYEDMALYFYEKKLIDKPTIHTFGRWCMKQITDAYALQMFQWNIARNRLEQHQQHVNHHLRVTNSWFQNPGKITKDSSSYKNQYQCMI